jgi:Zn-dependent protease
VSAFVAFVLAALLLVPALLVAIPVHEMGHAAAAYFQGDRSVRYFGYFTLDPRRFLDPLGVIAVFIALVGWGRRVPVQPNRINSMRQRLVHELGGPAANLLVAIVLGLLWRALSAIGLQSTLTLSPGVIGAAIYTIVFLNLSIFAFQLLPIPGLDGWDVIETLFRSRNPRFFFNVSTRRREIWIGAIVIVFLFQIFQGRNLLELVMSPLYTPASLISLGQCSGYGIPGLAGLHPCLPWGG